MLRKFCSAVLLSAAAVLPATLFAAVAEVNSPDGNIVLRVESEPALTYRIKYQGKTVVAPSKIGIKIKDAAPFGVFDITHSESQKIRQTWEYPWGRQRVYHDQYHSVTWTLKERNSSRTLGVEFRVYNDGAALRYLINKETAGADEYTLEKDLTEFNFNADHTAWFADYGSFSSSQEKPSVKQNLSTIGSGAHVGCPVVIQAGEKGPYLALTEAELNHWGGLYFQTAEPAEVLTLFDSGILKTGEAAKTFNVSVEGLQHIELIADKGDDSPSHDHADWCDLFLTDNNGKKINLTSLQPISAAQDWGTLGVNQSVERNPLRVGGKEYKTGFGTHASGRLVFDLSGKYKSLEGIAGVDEEDKDKGTGTVRFIVKSAKPQKDAKLHAALAPRKDGKGLAVAKTPDKSPWRVIIIAPKAIHLVDQTIVMNVSAPAAADVDWSWVKPGSASWDWWSDSNVNMSTASVKPFIDFAAEMGWQYHFVDDPWYAGKKYKMGDPRNNVLKGSDETNIEELAKYAKEKNIRLFLWLNWKDIDRQMNEAFAQYEKWGIAGVKIDFMDRDDQEMVEWYDKTVKKAAEHKLMVDFHGAYKPTGYRRAYPNLITREGIHGNEQNKWTKLTPQHYCALPYTRLLLGPADFTPGAFLNRHYDGKPIEGFKTAQGIGTRSHELAISLIYDSPIRCLCDAPDVYKKDPQGLDFYRDLPTVWDESRGVEGEIGEYFSLIRRKGNDWYYGAITDDTARTLTLPLKFLGRGQYEAVIYADTPETDNDARKIAVETKTVRASDTLNVKLAKEGGQVIVFKKIDSGRQPNRLLRNRFRRN